MTNLLTPLPQYIMVIGCRPVVRDEPGKGDGVQLSNQGTLSQEESDQINSEYWFLIELKA